jgi:PAS domain S-box-containing protein
MTESNPHPDSNGGHDANDDLRSRAEAKAVGGAPGESTDLFHELRVHQIELEMQNEELRRAQADLEASRARYFDLYDLAPVGYCTLDAGGIVQEANLTAARMFCVTKVLLVGKPLTDFIHHDSQDTFYRNRRLLQDSLVPLAFEMQFQRGSDARFWAWVEIRDSGGQPVGSSCRVAFTDVSLLKQQGQGGVKRDG